MNFEEFVKILHEYYGSKAEWVKNNKVKSFAIAVLLYWAYKILFGVRRTESHSTNPDDKFHEKIFEEMQNEKRRRNMKQWY